MATNRQLQEMYERMRVFEPEAKARIQALETKIAELEEVLKNGRDSGSGRKRKKAETDAA
jgi:hypothetical protein